MVAPISRRIPPASDELAEPVEVVPWAELCDYFASEHRLGEHVAVEGPTGSGKSVLALSLLRARGRRQRVDGRPVSITVMAIKPKDRTLTTLGWPRMRDLREWPPPYGKEQVILWPSYGDPTTVVARQRVIFREALREIMTSGGQIVYIDEAAYFEEPLPEGLGLHALLSQFWTMSRSNEVTLMAATQRPRRVSRSMWSEPYWLFLFRPEDEDDLRRVAQLSGFKSTVLEVVPQLGTHEFLLLRRRPRRIAVVSQVSA